MEIIKDFQGECQLYLKQQLYIEHCFAHVSTDINDLIKRYEYLKNLVESTCSEEDLKRCMEGNGFLKGLIESSTQDNQTLVEKIAALQVVMAQTGKCNKRLLEEANKQRKINDYEELTRKLVECQKENKKLKSQVAALGQEKAQWKAEASFWYQKGDELSHRYDLQASEIEDIVKDVAVVKQEMARVIELAEDDPAAENQEEGPCKEIKGVLRMGIAVISQFESSVYEQISSFQHDIYQITQANSSLETKCWILKKELKMVSEEKACFVERLASKRNGLEEELKMEKLTHVQTLNKLHAAQAHATNLEVELSALREKHVESEVKLENTEAQAKRLEEELQEERRRLSEQITTVEEKDGLEEGLKLETLEHGKTLNSFYEVQVHAANLEVELSALREKQVESDAKLENAEVQVKQLEEELQEERRRLSEQITAVEERNKLLYKARQENVTMQQENAQHVEMFQEQFNTLNCHVKSLVLKLHATEEKLTVALHQDEMMKHLVHTLEKRKAVIHLEEKMDSLEMDRSQHLNTITMLENKIKEMNESFDKELVSREEHIEDLQQEVEELEKDREQLISINGDVAGEIQECQSRIECLSLAVDKVMESLTGQTLEKENMTAQDAVTSTPRPQVLSQPEKFQSCLSVLSEVRERVTERTANAQQVNRLTGCSQITCTSAVTTTEYSRQNCVCTADDNVVTSAMNTVEDIKAQLRATVVEEMKNRNQEHIAMSKAQEAESELKEKCEELGKIRLELKVAKNKHSSVKRELHELKQQNRHLVKDLSDAGDTMKRTDHEKTNLQHDVEKGLRTIRKQCNMIKELKNTIKNLSKMSHERSATTKFEPKSSRGIQEKAYAQVTMKMPPHKVANKYQSSTESAQDTADHSPSGSNSADDGAYRYEQIKSELELRMKIMESLHHTEVENLNRVHKENVTSLKKAYERESAKERKMYEELVGKQQEMHEEQINELNQLRDSELSFLWDNRERECISEETQTPEDWTGTLAAGEEVSPAQDNGSTDPVTAKGSILLIEENTSDVRVKVSEQQHAEEVDSLKIDHARKLAEITEELRNSLAEEEASLENQLQALRKGNEQKLLWLKTKYRSEMKHENEKFNHCRRGVLEYANKSLSVSKTEVVEIKPSGCSTLEVARDDASCSMPSGSNVQKGFHPHALRRLVHGDSEALTAKQLADLHKLVCPTSCSAPMTSFRIESSPQSVLVSRSDFSNERLQQRAEQPARRVLPPQLQHRIGDRLPIEEGDDGLKDDEQDAG